MSEQLNSSSSSLSFSFTLLLLFFLLLPPVPANSSQTLNANPYFQPHNLLVTSRPFKLSSSTSLSSYIAFAFSPNATETRLALLLFSSKSLPFSDPGSEKPLLSAREEGLVGVVFDDHANNVGVCVGSLDPSAVRDLGSVGLVLGGGEKLRSWVDYDASSKKLEVRVQKSGSEDRPYEPVLAHPVNLSGLWGDGADLRLGISSVSKSLPKDGDSDAFSDGSGSVSVFSWEYRVRELPSSMHSMPVDPDRFSREHNAVHRRVYWVLGIVVGCVALAACLAFLVWKMVGSRKIEPGVDFKYEKVHVVVVKKDGAGSGTSSKARNAV